METLFLVMVYGLVIVLDVLRHIRFVLTRNAEPNRILTAALRTLAFFAITVFFFGFSWKLMLAIPMYVSMYWIVFDSLFEFAIPELYRMLVHPGYKASTSVAKAWLESHFPGIKGVAMKGAFVATSLISFLILK